MATTFITPTVVAKEALMSLDNNLVLSNVVYKAYSPEFARVGSTVLVRKPHEFATVRDFVTDTTVVPQTIVESSVAVKMDKLYDITFPITSRELSLDVQTFSEQCIAPAMRAHAQSMDALIAAEYVNFAAHYPVSGTPGVGDIAGVRTQLNLNKVPFGDRSVVMHPQSEQAYIVLDAFLHAEKRGDTQALKEASMGRVFGMDWYMDQNIKTHTEDIATAPTQVGANAASAATVIKVIGATSTSATLPKGDVFKIAGETNDKGHVLTAAAELSGGSASVTIAPGLQSSVASGASLTWQKTHKANLALHKNAIALVTAPLEPPLGGARGAVETYKGLTCRVVYDYTSSTKTNNISIDILFGIKTLDIELGCRLCDAR